MTLPELDENTLCVFSFESIAGLDSRGEKTALLGHRAFLSDQKVALVGVQKKDAADREGTRAER